MTAESVPLSAVERTHAEYRAELMTNENIKKCKPAVSLHT